MSTVLEEPAVFVMPVPCKGQVVFWFEGAKTSRPPANCIVERVHRECVDLKVLESTTNRQIRIGVRHVKDPRLATNPEWAKEGGWDFTPWDNEVRDTVQYVKDLRAQKAVRPKDK